MDKLEHYLDQVCRSIGGPRALRQHVRQELAEHLRDAAAMHKAAGLSEDEALAKALADFGGPDEVRSELEATHGHRLLPVVIDKAMQWKENTMRAKWLWTTWAYIAVVLVLVMEFLTIAFAEIYLVPKLKVLRRDGWITSADDEPAIQWLYRFLDRLEWVGDYFTWFVLGLAAIWGLFEWKVRSENKTFMRLSALATGGVGLMIVVFLMLAVLVLPFMMGLPGSRIARPWALEAVAGIEKSITALEQAATKKDWDAMQEQAGQVSRGLTRLEAGPSLSSLTSHNERPTPGELREHLKSARVAMTAVEQAVQKKSAEQLDAALEKFRKAYEPLKEAARRVGK